MSSNVIRLRLAEKSQRQQAMREKASLWIVRISAGASDEDLEEVHAWLDEHPDHVLALMDAARMWDEVSVLSELSDVFPLQEYLKPHAVNERRNMMHSAFAALLLVVGLCIPILLWLQVSGGEPGTDVLQLSYETQVGQQSTVVLPDGSVVVLNTNTKIDISFSPKYRDIILHRGEGHFTVAKNKTRPFRVHTNDGVVEAVGTAFTVQQLEQKVLEVTVLEGEVSVMLTPPPEPTVAVPATTPPEPVPGAPSVPPPIDTLAALNTKASPISLIAGESLHINENDGNVIKENVTGAELESRLAWRQGMLLFQGDSLEKAIREVSRYTDIQIDVDEKVRDISVLGNFRTGDIEGMLLSLSITFNLQVERLSEDHIVLKSAN